MRRQVTKLFIHYKKQIFDFCLVDRNAKNTADIFRSRVRLLVCKISTKSDQIWILVPEISRFSVILSSRQLPLWKGDSLSLAGRNLESSVKSQWNLNIGSGDIAGQSLGHFGAFSIIFHTHVIFKKNFSSQKCFFGCQKSYAEKKYGVKNFLANWILLAT